MANDKTEEATPKRKKESRKKGQVPKSADLTGWVTLLVGLYVLPSSVRGLTEVFNNTMLRVREMAEQPRGEELAAFLATTLLQGFLAVTPLVLTLIGVTVVMTVGQTGLLLTGKPLKPDFKRLNPIAGFKRLFSIRSLWETGKQLLKVAIIVAVGWPKAKSLVTSMVGHGRMSLSDALPVTISALLGMARTIAWTVVILSVADYGYQRYQNRKDLRMSKQEIRDEVRQAEGDQMVKGRIRSLQRAMARNRMIADVGTADVIVTNPTHIAVALRYDSNKGGAPVVVAVGAGAVAAKIRLKAAEHHIPAVEAKPLARALWRACEPGDPIPVALYEAVAKVLAFVRRLDRRMIGSKPLDLPQTSRVSADILNAVERKRRRRRF